MTQKAKKPFGLWPSPIQPASLAQSLRLSDVAWGGRSASDSDGETLVWLEGRSDQGVLVCAPDGQAPRDLTSTLSVRARVGYGGGDLGVAHGYVYFVAEEVGLSAVRRHSDGATSLHPRLYRQSLAHGDPQPISPSFGHMASPTPSPDGKWLVYVYTHEDLDGLGIIDVAGESWPQKLVHGRDFYMQPCWHPDGTWLAWVSWNHPDMPWDHTVLELGQLETDECGRAPTLRNVKALVDKPGVAIFQPQFSPDGRALAYISDESGWDNLYLYDLESGNHRQLTNDPVEVGKPAWRQGLRTYAFDVGRSDVRGRSDTRPGQEKPARIYYVRNEAGFDRLWVYDLDEDEARPLEVSPRDVEGANLSDYTELSQIAIDPRHGRLAFVASSSTISTRVISYSPGLSQENVPAVRVHRRSTGETVPAEELATPCPVHWTAPDGSTVHGLLYSPTSQHYTSTGLPPAIVHIHGGPTSQARAGYNAQAQFFATRGYSFLEVNYRGSTGYGKSYMAALRGKWGVLDAEDAIGGAQYMVKAGLADPKRLVIMGGSAGGYTVLKVLVDHPGFFRAAICLYGVSNMFTLATDTHKFEERYLDSMLGPLPEASEVYYKRSPIFHADKIVDPIAIFQGEIDRVVPKAQSEEIVASLRQRGIPHEYHLYEGEGHGWRKRETIENFYQAVEAFLRQYVVFA